MCSILCKFHTLIIPLFCIFDIHAPLYDTFARKAILFYKVIVYELIVQTDVFLDMTRRKFYNRTKMGLEG